MTQKLIQKIAKNFAPPPRLKVSEWADQFRKLSPESSAEPGQWVTARAEYQRDIMDAVNDPAVTEVVVMTSAQIGKTEALGNIVAYYVTQDASPMLMLQPTLEMAETYSKDRLAPMVRDCPHLTDKIGDPRSRKTDNTLLHKTFPGGHITLAGANSAASLASRPVRVVLCDEVDRYPASAGTEGDPVNLARKRTVTFWNRKLILTSTPTIKGASRIESAFLKSDQRRYFVKCPHCQHEQVFVWAGVKWDDDPKSAWYECGNCNRPITNGQKLQMVREGKWKATAEFTGIAGFHLNELYSPWRTFGDVADDFVKAKDDPQKLKVWVNTSLGETWDDQQGETPQFEELASRAENYSPSFVPKGGLFLTAGVDVQADRLAVVVKAWGRGEESWLIYWGEIFGEVTQPKVWQDLDTLLTMKFEHELETEIAITCTAIDSGFKPQEVYNFARSRRYKVLATKGMSTPGKPILGRASKQDVNYRGEIIKGGVKLFPVGTDVGKDLVYSRIKIREGAGRMHFPQGLDDDYFMQLTAEKLMVKFVKGVPVREWVKVRARNEALDCEVLAYAAALAAGLNRANWDKLEAQLQPQKVEEVMPEKTVNPVPAKKPQSRGQGFVGGW
ncbi:MAG: phage terminase large subunit family protein [Sphaerospermopsis kisseleviana]